MCYFPWKEMNKCLSIQDQALTKDKASPSEKCIMESHCQYNLLCTPTPPKIMFNKAPGDEISFSELFRQTHTNKQK